MADIQQIVGWLSTFCGILLSEKFSIRSAVLSIEVEEKEKVFVEFEVDREGKGAIKIYE